MAAITPHLEQVNDPSETEDEREFNALPEAELESFGSLGDTENIRSAGDLERIFDTGELTAEVLSQSHAKLTEMAWLRSTVRDSLYGVRYKVQAGAIGGGSTREVHIVLDRPIGVEGSYVAPWNPAASPTAQQYKLLSWTTKMGTPSFSLPAGVAEMGGACPGASAGQSITPVNKLHAYAENVYQIIKKPVQLARSICQHCYAEGGQYSTGGVQFAQVLRHIWVKAAVDNGSFVETMTYAIDNANFQLKGGQAVNPDATEKNNYLPERDGRRYFRIHDSGDFYNDRYLAGWVAVAKSLPDITFWAPSRIWATPWGVQAVNDLNDAPNLIIRPSAYHINEEPPRNIGPGWSAGTTVYHHSLKPEGPKVTSGEYDWDCQAYASEKGKTCRNAKAPDGKVGCRACWKHDDLEVNYTLH